MTGQRGASYRDLAWARGFARLIQPWPPADKYPKPPPIVMARLLGQLELFPLPKRRPPEYQLQLPLMGGRWWGLVVFPELEKLNCRAPATDSLTKLSTSLPAVARQGSDPNG